MPFKLNKKTRKRAGRTARRMPWWVVKAANGTVTQAEGAAYKHRQLGKMGAASEVRHIDPATGEVVDKSK